LVEAVTSWLHAGIAAFQFLTRLPVPVTIPYTEETFSRSVVFYPWVGAVLGTILALVGAGVSHLLPSFPASALLTGLWICLTGGLHLDGLMDTADGILSHRSRERMLEIMKDSRVGAMGVIACVLQLMMKTSLLYALMEFRHAAVWLLLIVIPLWSRTFMAGAIAWWPYARTEQGLGGYFRRVSRLYVLLAIGFALLISLPVLIGGHSAFASTNGKLEPLLLLSGIVACTYGFGCLIAHYLHRKLGGLTGDTYGALNEMLETLLLLALSGWLYA
jgi:adenosylcobinamide-GDP ribazoletransferase